MPTPLFSPFWTYYSVVYLKGKINFIEKKF